MPQFILSDSESNNDLAIETHDIRDFFSSKKSLNAHKTEMPLGILSECLKETFIFLYDNPLLLDKFPQGLVTENMILIPVEVFHQARKDFSITKSFVDKIDDFYLVNSCSDWGQFLKQPLLESLQLKLNVQLTENEKIWIDSTVSNNLHYMSPSYKSQDEHINFTVSNNKELLNILKNEDLGIIQFLAESILSNKENHIYFKNLVANKPEYLDNLPTVAQAVEQFTHINSDLVTYEQLKNNVRHFSFSESSCIKVLSDIYQVVDNINTNSHGDTQLFLEQCSKNLFPILENADDSIFAFSVQYIKETVFTENKDANHVAVVTDFCLKLNEVCTNTKRTSLLQIMSDFYLTSQLKLPHDNEIKNEHMKDLNTTQKPKI